MENPIPWEQAYIARYISGVPAEDIQASLQAHFRRSQAFLETIPEKLAGFAYAEGKWTLLQVMGHVVDSQVIFAYRALCMSRGEAKPLPGFEEKDYAVHWRRVGVALADMARFYRLQSQATLAQAETLTREELDSPGIANGIGLSARQVYRALVGHERHHLGVLTERYGVASAPSGA